MRQIITTIAIFCSAALVVSAALAHQWCWTCDRCNTYGWQLMTPEERKSHQARLAGFTGYSGCRGYIDAQRREMEERAREKGLDLPVVEQDPCDAMKGKGILK